MASKEAAPQPSRRFGQNFLAHPQLALALVEHFQPGPDERVVEIGPGRGALTLPLAARAGRLVALELDRRLVPALEAQLAAHPAAEVREADALELDFDALARELGGPLRVIGNLPYNVGTAIFARLLASASISDMQVLLQREVGERLLAAAGTKAYGPLSVLSALRAEGRLVRRLGPGCFSPRPKVESVAIAFRVREDAELAPHEVPWLSLWLRRGFSMRRKTLVRNLSGPREADEARRFLAERELPLDLRAEALAPLDWLALARRLDRLSRSSG